VPTFPKNFIKSIYKVVRDILFRIDNCTHTHTLTQKEIVISCGLVVVGCLSDDLGAKLYGDCQLDVSGGGLRASLSSILA